MTSRTLLLAAAAALAVPSLALADGDAGDIGLRIVGLPGSQQIETTAVGDDGGSGNDFDGPAERVFLADLGEFEDGNPNIFSDPFPGTSETDRFVTNLPGFDSDELTFAPGVNVGIDIQTASPLFGGNLVAFDGTSTSAVPAGTGLQASFNTAFRRTDAGDGSPLFLPTFTGLTGGDEEDAGRWHRHYAFALFGGVDNANGNLQPPANGVYILEAELATQQPGVANSDPFFIVFGINATEPQVDAAVEFLGTTIPEPASLALLGVGGLTLLRRRRRA